jgi:hypothetical protein
MAHLKITTNTNADAVWLWELIKKLGYMVEVLFDSSSGDIVLVNRDIPSQNPCCKPVTEISQGSSNPSGFVITNKPSGRSNDHSRKKTARKRRK